MTAKKKNRFLGFLFEDEVESNLPPKTEAAQESKEEMMAVNTIEHSNEPRQMSLHGSYDEGIAELLDSAIEEANLDGEDYFEFAQGLNNMKSIPMAESVKAQVVLATLSSKGLTAERVVETAEHYRSALAYKKSEFEAQVAKQISGKVGDKEQQLQDIDNKIGESALLIKTLTKEINEAQQTRVQIEAEIQKDKLKIQSTINSFEFTYNLKVKEIDENVKKVLSLNEK